jgi:Fe-S-cluster containining protein
LKLLSKCFGRVPFRNFERYTRSIFLGKTTRWHLTKQWTFNISEYIIRAMSISCENCNGACCSSMNMMLNDKEAKLLESHGTKLNLLIPITTVTRLDESTGTLTVIKIDNLSLYSMDEECKCLLPQDNSGMRKCMIYDSRPDACREFEMGAAECILCGIVNGTLLTRDQNVGYNTPSPMKVG